MPDETKANRGGKRRAAVWLAILAAAWLRLQGLEWMEFKDDEAAACLMADGVARGKWLPQTGLSSGVGVSNFPAFVYLLAAPSAVSRDPIWLTAFIGLLNTAAVAVCWRIGRDFFSARCGAAAAWLFAAAPWAVLYSRKIWAQSVLPLVDAALLYALLQLLVARNRRFTFWVVFLALLAPQFHFAGGCALLATGALLAAFRPAWSWRGAAAGALAAALVAAPYLWRQARVGFADVRCSSRVASGGSSPRDWLARAAVASRRLLDISGMGDPEYVLGRSLPAFRAESRVPLRAHWLWLGLLGAGLLAGVGAAGRRRAVVIVVLWCVGPVAVYGFTGIQTWPHYLVVAYPAPFLIMGWTLLATRRRARWALAAVSVAALVGAAFDCALLAFVQRHAGAAGDYGVAYRHKRDAAAYVASLAPLDHLYISHDTRGETTLRADYRRLVTLHAERLRARPGRFVRVVIVEPGRTPLELVDWEVLARAERRCFGPIEVYNYPLPRGFSSCRGGFRSIK